jgi:flagellar biosynthesis/type III secretory pathway chaperone
MSEREPQIQQIEERNSELAKEILLNESATYETEKEIAKIEEDILDHPVILNYIQSLKILIERISKKNEIYKAEIFENELKIRQIRGDDKN